MTEPADERRHEAGLDPLWNESWYFDFTTDDGTLGGYARLGLYPNLGVAWYWAALVREGEDPVVVRHHEVRPPVDAALEVREDGLWGAMHCETPLEHWTVGLEAFALALDDPFDAYAAEPRGDRVPLGFDLEWEAVAPCFDYPGTSRYEQSCRVSGEVLIGTTAIDLDGFGQRDHSWGVRDWWSFGWVWTAGRLPDGTAFHATSIEHEGFTYGPGYVARQGALAVVSDFRADISGMGETARPAPTAMVLGDLEVTAVPLLAAPVRLEGPSGQVGGLARALCRFESVDGSTGYGWTEWNRPGLAQ